MKGLGAERLLGQRKTLDPPSDAGVPGADPLPSDKLQTAYEEQKRYIPSTPKTDIPDSKFNPQDPSAMGYITSQGQPATGCVPGGTALHHFS